jgi:hypothetical protein
MRNRKFLCRTVKNPGIRETGKFPHYFQHNSLFGLFCAKMHGNGALHISIKLHFKVNQYNPNKFILYAC